MNANQIILKGLIENIFPAEIKGSYEKRIFWLKEEVSNRPNVWALEMRGNDGNVLEDLEPGDRVECHVTIKGNSWDNKGKTIVFNSLHCTLIK